MGDDLLVTLLWIFASSARLPITLSRILQGSACESLGGISVEQIGPHLAGTVDQPLRFHDLDVPQRDRSFHVGLMMRVMSRSARPLAPSRKDRVKQGVGDRGFESPFLGCRPVQLPQAGYPALTKHWMYARPEVVEV